jgi:hypothetical protein
MHSVTFCLYLASFIGTIAHAAGKAPLWPWVLLVIIGLLLAYLPLV